MKSTIILLIASICCVAVFILSWHRKRQDANNINESWTTHGNHVHTKIVVLEGHKYIILNRYYGVNIIHAESCNCKSK